MNLTEYITANPTKFKLTQPQKNLLVKLDNLGVMGDMTADVKLQNPVTGYTTTVNPFVAKLIKWTYAVYETFNFDGKPMVYNGKAVAIGTYDRVRYLILAIDPVNYSKFID